MALVCFRDRFVSPFSGSYDPVYLFGEPLCPKCGRKLEATEPPPANRDDHRAWKDFENNHRAKRAMFERRVRCSRRRSRGGRR